MLGLQHHQREHSTLDGPIPRPVAFDIQYLQTIRPQNFKRPLHGQEFSEELVQAGLSGRLRGKR